jgi:hypothetical protein
LRCPQESCLRLIVLRIANTGNVPIEASDFELRPLPRLGRSVRKPFPDWVEYTPNSIWIYDTTHFTRAGVAATVVEDLVSRK